MPAMKTSIGRAPERQPINYSDAISYNLANSRRAGRRVSPAIGHRSGQWRSVYREKRSRSRDRCPGGDKARGEGRAGLCNRPIKRDRGPLAREFGNYGPVLMTSDPTRGVKRRERWRGGWLAARGEAWPCRVTACNELEPWTRRLLLPSSTIPPLLSTAMPNPG